ncbi:WD40 repeat-containing protein [Tieghemostelium lacteum]|uniref:WD40 repeat-containing protein n=1 Tax=Tieghemostelium lacteum TaxID=361077 RepID=A0A152A8X7_TIELA|nr:WD40 repeat-containing protein [Tieghemostelium lacteum]|eukprot:KYR02676.1 WD40 repeat-containing protein [Tieghemostelium lacteum]
MKSLDTNRLPSPKSHKFINLASPLSAISLSPDSNKLIVAGRDTVKIIALENELKIINNLKVGKTQSLNYTGNDCSWNPSLLENYKTLIATAATNGVVVIWNTGRDGTRFVERLLSDHSRAVNKLAWHPEKHEHLLTGSQDTTLRFWDIRDPVPSKFIFQPKSEAIRDVQFNPYSSNQFAAAFDNGTVQLWDIRKNTNCVEKITAHQGLVLTLDWHPDERNMIASGGRDRFIRVWDFNSPNQPLNNISTISSVSRVKWRPGYKWNIASCSSIVDFEIHLWDVKKPYIPLASFNEHRDVPTALLWQNPNNLISCGKDGYVLISSINDAYLPYKHIRTTGVSWSVHNDLAIVNDKINRNPNYTYNSATDAIPLQHQFPSFFLSFNVPTPILPNNHNQNGSSASMYNQNATDQQGLLYVNSPVFQSSHESVYDQQFLFEYFAKNYRFNGMSFQDLCSHNEQVSLQVKQYHTSKIWSLMKLHFHDDSNTPDKQIKENNSNHSNNMNNNNNSNSPVLKDNLNSTKISNHKSSHQRSDSGHHSNNSKDKDVYMELKNDLVEDLMVNDVDNTIDPLFNILSAEAVTPLAPLPIRASSPSGSTKLALDSLSIGPSATLMDDDLLDDEGNILVDDLASKNDSDISEDNDSLLVSTISENQKSSHDRTGNNGLDFISTRNSGNGDDIFDIPEFDFRPILIEMLEYCIEKGDIQTCVFVILILKSNLDIEKRRITQWFHSYIELLQRLKMWTYVLEIIKNSDDPSINQASKKHTTILCSCACGRSIPQGQLVCEKCSRKPSVCSLCHLPVKGNYVWCQGCSHGGHLNCLKQWFEQNRLCPTGCSHLCSNNIAH